MAKRRKQKSRKTKPSETIGGLQVEEQVISEHDKKVEKKPTKQIEKLSDEKVVPAPQTYTEDTFNLEDQNTEEIVIENEIKKKTKKIISRDELYILPSFKSKLARIKAKVEFEKSFEFLFDFVSATKAFKTYDINETEDEFTILMYEVVLHFKKRLARIDLPYKEYQIIDGYFESLKTLYRKFKNKEMVENDKLVEELNSVNDLHKLITLRLF